MAMIVIAIGAAIMVMMAVFMIVMMMVMPAIHIIALVKGLFALLLGGKIQKFGWRHLLLIELDKLKREIDYLFFIDGRTQLIQGSRVLFIELQDLALLAGILAGALDHRAAQLVVGDADLVFIADFRQDQT